MFPCHVLIKEKIVHGQSWPRDGSQGPLPGKHSGACESERLERFFTKQDNAYQVKREWREMCIFSNHSFIKDPPFAPLDLISCRNVVIYLGLDLQRKIIPLFHYALRDSGYVSGPVRECVLASGIVPYGRQEASYFPEETTPSAARGWLSGC